MILDWGSGMYFDRARIYSPSMGRFTSKDPIGFAGGDLNPYRYVNNNAVESADPTGLFNDNSPKDPIPLSPQGVGLVCNPTSILGLAGACYVTTLGTGLGPLVCPVQSEIIGGICTYIGSPPVPLPSLPSSSVNSSPEIPSLPSTEAPFNPEGGNSCRE